MKGMECDVDASYQVSINYSKIYDKLNALPMLYIISMCDNCLFEKHIKTKDSLFQEKLIKPIFQLFLSLSFPE